jgi:ethanolamine ammonia-lyase small subunit
MPSGFEDLDDEKDVAAVLLELKRDHFISVPTSRVGRSMPTITQFRLRADPDDRWRHFIICS